MDAEPACWAWPIPAEVRALASAAYPRFDNRPAVRCLRAWRLACSVCGRTGPWSESRHPWLAVDHDHASGLIRGLLCVKCNAAEPRQRGGVFEAYRIVPAAYLVGLVVPYRYTGGHRERTRTPYVSHGRLYPAKSAI